MRFSHDFMGFDGIWWDFKKHHMGQKQGDFSCQHGCKKKLKNQQRWRFHPETWCLWLLMLPSGKLTVGPW
jgi:hypothetical protein